MAWILLLIIIAVALGLVGAVVHGLLYLLVIGVIVFLIALVLGATVFRRGGRHAAR
ncbi:hypothetical protein [Streptacidiphilus monticola]|jgi:hypothetical protein|uniref:DUF2207 domain-containing protein n=1 Tax=Streptacidiphilus monticola TaxID=2161674 RepID=A0ABW1GAA2_9ACTN